jgi:hypothetical protein
MAFEKGITPEGAKPFKKGQSGNPKGRPKLPNLKEAMAKVLAEEKDGMVALDAVLLKLRQMAMKGNPKAIEMLLDRGYGKPNQKTESSVKLEDITPPIKWS